MSVIDDLKYIHQKDTQDALGIASKQWQQLEHRFDVLPLNFEVDNIVFSGMGGSALSALLSKTWPGYSVPFEIVRGYHMPHYVSSRSLVIASSYSGNTEETISAFHEAIKLGANVVCISSGGELAKLAVEHGCTYIELPTAAQPRFATLYSFKAFVTVLEKAGLVKATSAERDIHQTAKFLQKHIESWSPVIPAPKNPAKKLALDILGLSPVVYGGPLMAPAAYKWKISFNENAKNVAWWNEFPEFNHNEFMGWASHPIDKPYAVIDLRSSLEDVRITKRFELSAKLLSGKRPAPHVIQAEGETLLEQLLYTMTLGDFVSLYLALLNGLNPTPVELIEKFKVELAK
ncbi:bifunctional phosphoglucose/phosphomannose isomerase [Candidatus Saccharibacteria bacterium]|nr:bifunctional phosphoglucose/phosphomannose isomerase [Candidatus Saccharibacteria bacterium]